VTEASAILGSSDSEGPELWVPVPDVVDLVVEAAAMEAVFAAERLVRIDRMRRELLAEAVGRGSAVVEVIERSIRLELACAMRITEYSAGRMIVHAEALTHRYPEAWDALHGARITMKHAEILIDEVDQLTPDLRAQVTERALELAIAEPVGTFRRALRALVATVQAATLQERYQTAVQTRRVVIEPGYDGMGDLLLHAPEVALHAIFDRATRIAKTIVGAEGETRTLDQVRADVLCDLLTDGVTDATPAQARGIRAQVVVTVPALALLEGESGGTADPATGGGTADPAVVEGVGPIPLSVAKQLCGGDAHWMRVLTHPETGMVLSVGREQYRPPAMLKRLVKWRADRCMAPGCGMPASRCEIDHQTDWQHGGETALHNNAPFCTGHHTVKHHGDWTVTQLEHSGGAIEWTSPTGRKYVVHPERRTPTFRTDIPAPDNTPAPF
jgi:hypothetical protein